MAMAPSIIVTLPSYPVDNLRSVNSIVALRAIPSAPLEDSENIVVDYGTTVGDNMGGVYSWGDASLAVDNGTTIIRPTDLTSLQAGRWLAINTFQIPNSVNLPGTPTAPTAAPGTNNTQIANTAFVVSGFVDFNSAQTLTNKTLTTPVINYGGLIIFPNGPETLVGLAATQTLANKTLTSPTLTSPTINAAPVLTVSGTAPIAGFVRAWVNFNGTGTIAIRGSGNVSSVTDGGVGVYTPNFTVAMPDANYGYALSGLNNNIDVGVVSRTSSSILIGVTYTDGNGLGQPQDVSEVSMVIVR